MNRPLTLLEIRRATPADVPAILEIKHALRLELEAATENGGFLLGSSPQVYEQLASIEAIALIERDGQLLGFSTMLNDALFRSSEVFERREQIDWRGFSPEEILEAPIAYFDQLAIRPDDQRGYVGAFLAMHTMDTLTASSAHVFTTTLLEPIENRAALPLIHKIGGRQVGTLTEVYPDVGEVTSAIFHLAADAYQESIERMRREGSVRERETIAAYDAWCL